VTRSRSGYRLFYVASVLVAAAALVRLIRIGYLEPVSGGFPGLYDPTSWFYLCFYQVPLVAGVTLSVLLAWRNWGWLLGKQSQ